MSAERVIVLLDDVEQMTAIGADLLQRRLDNVRVVPFNKPREALAWMATAPRVDLVLTDFHMAEMDGLAFLLEARTLHPHAARAIITAYLDLPTTTAPELGARGVHALIRKPWEWSDFTRAVFELLSLAPPERAASERVGPMAYPEGAFAELSASRASRAAAGPAPPARSTPTTLSALSARTSARSTTPAPSPSPGPTLVAAPLPSPSPSPAAPRAPAPLPPPSPPTAPSAPAASPAAPAARAEEPAISPIPAVSDEEEARRLLAYLQTRPGVAARIRAAVEQAAAAEAQRRAPPPAGRGG